MVDTFCTRLAVLRKRKADRYLVGSVFTALITHRAWQMASAGYSEPVERAPRLEDKSGILTSGIGLLIRQQTFPFSPAVGNLLFLTPRFSMEKYFYFFLFDVGTSFRTSLTGIRRSLFRVRSKTRTSEKVLY